MDTQQQLLDQLRALQAPSGSPPPRVAPPQIVGHLPEGRPIVRNPDGSVSTHRAFTVGLGDKYYALPTMYGGRTVSENEAIDIFRRNRGVDPDTGQPFVGYATNDEATAAYEQTHRQLEATIQRMGLGRAEGAAPPADKEALLQQLRQMKTPQGTPREDPPPAVAPGSPEGASYLSWLPGFEFLQALPLEQQQQVAGAAPGILKDVAATGISTATSLGGAALGTLTSPVTGPVGPLVGEMAGSIAGREINKRLGLEEPGTFGDVAAAAGPLVGRAIGYGARLLQGTTPPAAQEILALGRQHDIPVGYADLPGARTAKSMATALEKVPLVGTGPFRVTQQQAAGRAADAVTTATRETMEQVPYRNVAAAQAAAARGDRAAQQVLDDIAHAGADWTRVVQASGNLRVWRARQTAGKLYDVVEQEAQGLGDIPLTQTMPVVDQAIAASQQAKVLDAPMLRFLTDLREQLQSHNPFAAMRLLRSDLGDLVRDYYKGTNAVVGGKGVGVLQEIKRAVEDDMKTFATQSGHPALRAAWFRADRFYREQVIPYKDAALAKALTSDTPDEIYHQFVQRGKGDRAEKFYRALDPKGQAAVRYGMVEEALEKAQHPTLETFSPAKFAKSLEDIQEAYGVFFRGRDKWELDGFKRLLRHVERAGQVGEDPPTGQRVIQFLLASAAGTGAVTAPLETAAVGATIKGTSWLLTSPAGRRVLLAASRATPGSPAMDRVAQALLREGARTFAPETTAPEE